MQIKATPSFLRHANKLFKRNPQIKEKFRQTVERLAVNPFDTSLKTHKLSGNLKEFWSCSVTYEIRLRLKITNDAVELLDIGNHDEIY